MSIDVNNKILNNIYRYIPKVGVVGYTSMNKRQNWEVSGRFALSDDPFSVTKILMETSLNIFWSGR